MTGPGRADPDPSATGRRPAGSGGVAPVPGRAVRVLFVCTANQVRSPYAEAVARRLAVENGIPVRLASAGFLDDGWPAFDEMLELADENGLDLTGHRSRRVTVDLLAAADLVVAMTGRHVIDLIGVDPDVAGRAVTLRELAAACEFGPPRWDPDEVRRWVGPVTVRDLTDLLAGGLDVGDPAGGPLRGYRATAVEIERLLAPVFGAT